MRNIVLFASCWILRQALILMILKFVAEFVRPWLFVDMMLEISLAMRRWKL